MRIFFATDIHGSNKCFQKFLNAGKFYKADTVILAGDITGKLVLPIIEDNGAYFCELMQSKEVAKSQKELDDLQKRIRDIGYYPYITTREEVQGLLKDPHSLDLLFNKLMCESVEKWIKIAEEKLHDSGIHCYISPGNDDRFEIDRMLSRSNYIQYPENRVVEIGSHEMITLGFTNMTPWKCPRDIPEDELHTKIETLAAQVKDLKTSIFNFHCPPYGTGIDQAPQLDTNLRPVLAPGGGPSMISVGSTSVRSAIEKHQPLLSLHGHIHESRGTARLGRTLCMNPGSEYTEGTLRGAIVEIENDKIVDFVLTAG